MAFYDKFPYTNFQEINLDEIITTVNALEKTISEWIPTHEIKFADPIDWDGTKFYDAFTIVFGPDGNSYIAKTAVPSGVALTNDTYWGKITDFNAQIALIYEQLPFIVPEQYGAIGDGVTDDTEAMEKAIAASAELSKMLFIPEKTYLISDTLELPPKAKLQGVSERNSIIKNSNDNVYAFDIKAAELELSNLKIDSKYGINIATYDIRPGYTTMSNLHFLNAYTAFNIDYDNGYNLFSNIMIKTLDTAEAIVIGKNGPGSGNIGPNYLYFNNVYIEPQNGHVVATGSTAVTIEYGRFIYFTQCDFVGFDYGMKITQTKQGGVFEINMDRSSVFDCKHPLYFDAHNFNMNDITITDCKITSYINSYIIEAPNNGHYLTNLTVKHLSVTDAGTLGFDCYGVREFYLDGHMTIGSSVPARIFNSCTFLNRQHGYRNVYVNNNTFNATMGDSMQLAPMIDKPVMFNYASGTYTYTYTVNTNNTVTVTITATGVVNGCLMF